MNESWKGLFKAEDYKSSYLMGFEFRWYCYDCLDEAGNRKRPHNLSVAWMCKIKSSKNPSTARADCRVRVGCPAICEDSLGFFSGLAHRQFVRIPWIFGSVRVDCPAPAGASLVG